MSQPFMRPDVRAFLDYLNAAPGPRIYEVDAQTARQMSSATHQLAEVPIGPLAVIRDLEAPGPAGPITLRLFDARASRGPGPVMVFFHGGGWVLGDLNSYSPVCAEIARQLDIPVISVDYRLAPEHRWPAAPDDCEAAARWIAQQPGALGLEATGLVLAGDSAGGNLAIITALALRDDPAPVPMIAQWAIYPATDLADKYPSFDLFGTDHFLTREAMIWFNDAYRMDLRHWRALPQLADQNGMPPTLVLTASLDPLRDQGRAYAAAAVQAGVPTVYREAQGTIHGFLTLRKALPSSQADLNGACAALKLMIAETAK
ncbi:alpha/beta hydrolase [Flavisphingomonas formosensis]|uniref:alpha/beta hydrolase n=1 Tax=Flavisphingomonas formosensis TaxID=861534 RepID=UPI001E38FE4D|nr:alpha/beta hydrolase [Sphingomonas formosensis]